MGCGGIGPTILNPVIDASEWPASCPYRFILGRKGSHFIENMCGCQESVQTLWRRYSNPNSSTVMPVKRHSPCMTTIPYILPCCTHVIETSSLNSINNHSQEARGSVVGLGTMLQAGGSRVRFPISSLDFSIDHNPCSRTMALGSTQVSNRNVYHKSTWA
jgi:hypothetical protein